MRTLTYFLLLFSLSALFGAEKMEVSNKLKSLWEDSAIKSRIERGIEENRKGDFELSFSSPVKNIKVELIRHEFVFGAPTMATAMPDKTGNIADKKWSAKMEQLVWGDLFNGATFSVLWKYYETEPDKFRFEKNSPFMRFRPPPVDTIEMCKRRDLTARLHCLSWFNKEWCVPSWVENSESAMAERSDKYFKKLCERFGDEVKYWNIANEYCRFYDGKVREYMHWDPCYKAFVEARKHLPESAIFTYNELTPAWKDAVQNREYAPTYLIVQNLLLRGCKVDELGLQLHIFSKKTWTDVLNGKEYTPKQLFRALDVYAKLNLPIQITEITIPGLPEGEVGEENQAFIAEKFYKLWFSHPNVQSITWWHTVDGTALTESVWKSGILTYDFRKKKSYEILHRLIKEEWKTTVFCPRETGRLTFRGFYGKYKVSYEQNGEKRETLVMLQKDSIRKLKID